ncbi:MAG: glycosyltransferase family 39 protein [Microgenomates group bacterium]
MKKNFRFFRQSRIRSRRIIFDFQKIFLTLIILLAGFLRLWELDKFPIGLNADEAAIGYNAYSLILTGKDEHGNFWPIHFKSFADYKPGGYFYLVLPFVKILGLNEWAVRLPSALIGIGGILGIFLLVKEIFGNQKLALISALFLAISPWHIHFSRGGWETNIASTFILFGVYFFLRALKEPKFFIFSFLFWVFSLYTYHSPRIIIPLLGLNLIVFFKRHIFLKKNFKHFLIGGIIAGLISIPLLVDFFGPAGTARFSGLSLFSDIGPYSLILSLRGEHQNSNEFLARILHNRPFIYGIQFLKNYLSFFDGNFLFLIGDRVERNNSSAVGEMYFLDLIFIFAGIYFFFRKKPKNWFLPFVWLLIAPIAGALTFQVPSALRAHNMVFPLIIISAYGFFNLLNLFKSKFLNSFICLFLSALLFWNFFYFLHQYFVHYPKTSPQAWEYGFRELVEYLKPIKDNYSKIYVTEKYDQPYILFLFYLQYPPEIFQKEVILTPRDKFGFSTVRHFANFHFENIDWKKLEKQKNVLIVGTEEEIPPEAKIIKIIYFPNGKPAFKIAEI